MEEVPAITLACARYRFDGVPVVAARRADSGKPGQRDRSHKTARDRRTVADPGNGYLASGFDRGDERTGRIEYDVVIGTVHLAVDPPPDASAAAVPRHLGWGSVRLPEAIVAPSAIAACG